MNLPKISIERPVFISCVLSLILILGVVAYNYLGVDQYPDVNMPTVTVTTKYEGAGPEEIETLITRPMEEELAALEAVKKITSKSIEGSSVITVEFQNSVDANTAERRVKDKADIVKPNLPDDAKEPVVEKFDMSDIPAAILSYKTGLTPAQAYDVADQVIKPRLSQVSGVGVVVIMGGTKREIQVELDRNKLTYHHLSVLQVASRIASNGANTPIGTVHRGAKDVLERALSEFRDLNRLEKTTVNFSGSDVTVPLKTLGTVTDGTEEPTTHAFVNGQKALLLIVFKQSKANSIQTTDAVDKTLVKLTQEIQSQDPGAKVEMEYNTARTIRASLTDVKETILISILLTVIVVYLFLGSFRSTIITITSLPVSLCGAFILMNLMGFTLNVISLMALSLAVGLLVDDAIVVRENIWRHVEEGEDPIVAAEKGALQVAMAVVATTSVIIAVFMPIGFLSGTVGQYFRQLGFTICFAMGVSLFESMTMGPMLSAYWVKKGEMHGAKGEGKRRGPLARLLWVFEIFQKWLVERYAKVVRWCLGHRWTVVGIVAAVFMSTIPLLTKIPFNFMSETDTGEFIVTLKAKPGTSLDAMTEWVKKIDEAVRQHPEVSHVTAFAGDRSGTAYSGQMFVRMVDSQKRKVTTSEFKNVLREEFKPYEADLTIQFGSASPQQTNAFDLIITGTDNAKLIALSKDVIEKLGKINGLVDLTTSFDGYTPEFQVKLDPDKMRTVGVLGATVGNELRDQVAGDTTSKFRQNGYEYDVRVRLRQEQRDLEKEFPRILVPNQNDELVRLSSCGEAVTTDGLSNITRYNRVRSIEITGKLAKGYGIGPITKEAQQIMDDMKLETGYRYFFSGDTEDLGEMKTNVMIAVLLALVLTYLVLASLYESPVLPLTIMMAIPPALVGGIWALWMTGLSMDVFSMIGFVLLIGLVTKNSILLVDSTIHFQEQGFSRTESLIKAGGVRLRPILMTTLAMVAGMIPLALALSEVGKYRQGMGVVIEGGLIVSLLLTLLVVPSFYEIIDDIRLWFRRVLKMDGKLISMVQGTQSSVGDAEPITKNEERGVNP